MKVKFGNPRHTISEIQILMDSNRKYLAQRIQGGGGDWIYQILEIEGDLVKAVVGEVSVDRPTAVIDSKTREEEILEKIKDKISKFEKPTVITPC